MLQFIASNWQIKQNSFHCHDIVPSFLEHLYMVRTEKAATAQLPHKLNTKIKRKVIFLADWNVSLLSITCWSLSSPSESANFFPSRTTEEDPVERSCFLLWITSPDQLVKALPFSHCSRRANGCPYKQFRNCQQILYKRSNSTYF